MTPTRFGTWLGLALGAVWALTSFSEALLAGLVAAVGFLIGLVIEGRISVDVGDAFGSRDRTRV